jgi:hypothetical protein
MTLRISIKRHYAERNYVLCRISLLLYWMSFAKRHYAECRCAEYRYAEYHCAF